MRKELTFSVLDEMFAVCRLEGDAPLPDWALGGSFSSLTRTQEELSIVCVQANVPEGVRCEKGWRSLKLHGPLDFSLKGVIASIAETLARAGIGVFAISTFDTDYFLVKDEDLGSALSALEGEGLSLKPKGVHEMNDVCSKKA